MAIDILEDEIDKKRRELVEKGVREQRSPFTPTEVVGAEAGRIYRAAYDDPRRVAELESQGYRLEKGKKSAKFKVDNEKATGEHTYKDVVLMSCEQDGFVARHAAYRAEVGDRSLMVRDGARENINRLLVDEGGASARRDHTFDETVTGRERLFVEEEE
jgi:hypothetical protein